MRTFFKLLAAICAAVWLGWLVAMFVMVRGLFDAELVKGDSTAERLVIFALTEKAQLVLAAGTLIGLAGLQVKTRSKAIAAWFGMAVVAALLAAALPMFVTGPMEDLRVNGHTDSAQFKQLHGLSFAMYGTIVLCTGAVLTGLVLHRRHEAKG